MGKFLAIASVILAVSAAAMAKCGNLTIHVNGRILGPPDKSMRIVIDVEPDPNWSPQPAIALDAGEFAGDLYFDSTKAEGKRRDDCSREPRKMLILLLKNGQELDRMQLDIPRDFVKTSTGYRVRVPVELHSR